ncbi:MAG: hypothetical protein ACTSQ6_11665 [Candidatus Heimdallarchaeaceae archaeon]
MNKKAFLGIALIFVVSASMIPASAAEGDKKSMGSIDGKSITKNRNWYCFP